MTREEAYEQFGKTMLDISYGKVTFHHGTLDDNAVRVTLDDYVIYVEPVFHDGWVSRALLQLINKVIEDLKQKLKDCEIEEPALQERALRKVNIGRDFARTS